MTIRHAKPEDIDEMLRIYCLAKEYMDKSGNPTQWKPGHPNRAVLEAFLRHACHFARIFVLICVQIHTMII